MYKKKWQAARGGREAEGYKLQAAGCALCAARCAVKHRFLSSKSQRKADVNSLSKKELCGKLQGGRGRAAGYKLLAAGCALCAARCSSFMIFN
jgi:hypothetical protein